MQVGFTLTEQVKDFPPPVFERGDFPAAQGGCINKVTLLEAEFQFEGQSNLCIPFVTIVNEGMPVCAPHISGLILTEGGKKVKDTDVTPSGPCSFPGAGIKTTLEGNYGICLCGLGTFTVKPSRNDNYLNGVTTLDLASISKHILNLQPLGSPYKLIAADANDSKTITTLDIVALRRLILGIDEELPSVSSWRFVDKKYVFPNPANPFTPVFPEQVVVQATVGMPSFPGTDFVGIKVGDVNGTAEPKAPKGEMILQTDAKALQYAETISLLVKVQSGEALLAFQGAFQFDPAALEFIGPAAGDLTGVSADCFGLTELEKGIIRMVWVSPDPLEYMLLPGQTLCRLNFRARRKLAASEAGLTFSETDRLRPEGYTLNEDIYRLLLRSGIPASERTGTDAAAVEVWAKPNPAADRVNLVLRVSTAPGPVRLFVLDGFGRQMYYGEMAPEPGNTEYPLPGSEHWSKGMYTWVLLSGSTRISEGNFVKAQ
jgi:hypothetical protein